MIAAILYKGLWQNGQRWHTYYAFPMGQYETKIPTVATMYRRDINYAYITVYSKQEWFTDFTRYREK